MSPIAIERGASPEQASDHSQRGVDERKAGDESRERES
jgi:hypothetical protein